MFIFSDSLGVYPAHIAFAATAAIGDTFAVIGGRTSDADGTELDLVYMYDAENDAWVQLQNATLSSARSHTASFTIPMDSIPDC